MAMNDGQALHNSPYVEQIEKFASSLKQLSHTFLGLEDRKQAFSSDEIDGMFDRVKEQVCEKCEKCTWCWGENFVHTYQMGYEVLSAVDHYGNELDTETKRKLMQRCIMAPRFLREMLEGFHEARQNLIWTNRIARSREGCAIQMDTFADMIRSTAKELEDSIFTDERLEKRIMAHLKKKKIRVLYTHFFMNREGKYEVHVTARAMQKQKVPVKELVKGVSEAAGRRFIPQSDSAQMIGQRYMTVVCREGPAYYTMSGAARIGKGCSQISGDNFTMMEMPGGRKGVVLSDGMGSGEEACRESTLVIELLEELLDAGFPEKTERLRRASELHEPTHRRDECHRDRFGEAEIRRRRFCHHGNGRGPGRPACRGAGHPSRDDHTGECHHKSPGDGAACAGAGAELDREGAGR